MLVPVQEVTRPRGRARLRPAVGQPFTVSHFRAWARELELDNGEPWIVEDFFEAFVEDYFAGVPESWLIVPEENTKTTSLSGLAVYLLEHRHNPWIPWAASARDQAEIGYRQAEGLVNRSPRLKKLIKCQEGYRRLKRLDGGGRIQIFAAEADTGDGVIPTDAFLDELHRHRDLRLYRTWRGKLGKRGGQIGTISTAGEPGSDFESTRELIRQETPVIERRPGYVHCRSEHIALHEWALPEGGDPENMATVKLANPFSGITVESLGRKRATPTMTLQHWLRFVCNVPSRGGSAAITEAEWDAARVEDRIPAGTSIWLGLDVAWKWDTTAAVPFWKRDDEFRLFGPASIITPPRDGNSLHPDAIKTELLAIHQTTPLEVVVMDTSDAKDIAAWIEDEVGAEVIERGQSHPVAAAEYDAFMEALRNGWLHHTGDAGLTRHVLNAVARMLPRGDHIFDRPSDVRISSLQERRVIDALKAASMVHAQATAGAVFEGPSVYEERGMVAV